MDPHPDLDLTADERLIEGAVVSPEDREFDVALRPRTLDEFVGQERVKEQLALLIDGARARGETVDHLLFSGPPGLGKTTLAQIVAHEMGAGFQPTSGPTLDRPSDLAAILTNLGEGGFIALLTPKSGQAGSVDASVIDESAVTGESAPVIRESGGDRSGVTGGTRVLSDRIVVRVTANQPLPGPGGSRFPCGSASASVRGWTTTRPTNSPRSCADRPGSWASIPMRTAPPRSPGVPVALPGSRTDSCDASGTSRRSGTRAPSRGTSPAPDSSSSKWTNWVLTGWTTRSWPR